MIYPDTPIEEWRERYKLRRFVECYRCGEPIELDTPVAIQGYRGAMASEGCLGCMDSNNKPMVFKPVIPTKKAFWMRVWG